MYYISLQYFVLKNSIYYFVCIELGLGWLKVECIAFNSLLRTFDFFLDVKQEFDTVIQSKNSKVSYIGMGLTASVYAKSQTENKYLRV